MKILYPQENIDKIISLVESANEFVSIVSPYSYLEGWERLKEAINRASARNVNLSYFVRKGEGSKGLDGLNVNILEVEKLHAKMFFNENECIISSFHLMNNSDINWAFFTDNSAEYKELQVFFETYIKPLAEPFKGKSITQKSV